MAEQADKVADRKKEESSINDINEKKIATAVKFLQNANVRKTSFENRLSFLRKKGLTEEEIEEAIARSGTKDDKDIIFTNEASRVPAIKDDPVVLQTAPYTTPTSSSFASQLSSVLIGGGILYAAAYAVKVYVVPYFMGTESQEMASLEENIKQLSTGVNELSSVIKNTFTNLEENMKSQQATLAEVSAELSVAKKKLDLLPSDVTSLSDVKSEITSIKSLLLSRSQFPSTPFAPASTPPSIPAWQKASRREKAEESKVDSTELHTVINESRAEQSSDEITSADETQ